MTISACVLMADWQTIQYDSCTEYSPFHHPEITSNGSTTYEQFFSEPWGHPPFKRKADFNGVPFLSTLFKEIKQTSFPGLNEFDNIETMIQMSGDVQTLKQHANYSHYTAKMNCTNANITNHHCRWTPSSIFTGEDCEDCPPICRSAEQSLNFVQFALGTALLIISIPIVWVPAASITSNQVPKESQGIVMGFITAIGGIGGSVAPLICKFAINNYIHVCQNTTVK